MRVRRTALRRIKLTPIDPKDLQDDSVGDQYCAHCDELATCKCIKSVDKQGYWDDDCKSPTCQGHSFWHKGKPYCPKHFPLRDLYLKLLSLNKRKERNNKEYSPLGEESTK